MRKVRKDSTRCTRGLRRTAEGHEEREEHEEREAQRQQKRSEGELRERRSTVGRVTMRKDSRSMRCITIRVH